MVNAVRLATSVARLGRDVISIAEALGAQVWIVEGIAGRELRYVGGAVRLYVPPSDVTQGALAIADLVAETWSIAASETWRATFASTLVGLLEAAAPARCRVEQPQFVQLRAVVQR